MITNRDKKAIQALPAGAQVSELSEEMSERARKKKRKAQKRKLVRRSHLLTIVAAWVITVPAAALLSGLIFLGLNALF